MPLALIHINSFIAITLHWPINGLNNSMPVLCHFILLAISTLSFSLCFCPSPLSCHGSRSENSHLGCWCEQSQWSDWMVQLLLPWQLLPQRCLWNQAALDGCYSSRTLWNGKNRMSTVLKTLNEVTRCLYYWGLSSIDSTRCMLLTNYF